MKLIDMASMSSLTTHKMRSY